MPAKIFDGCVIALSGNLAQTHGEIKKLITDHGGVSTNIVNDQCTHLICSSSDLVKKPAKVKQAEKIKTTNIVKDEWLFESVSEKKRLAEASYLWTTTRSSKKTKGAPKSPSPSQKSDSSVKSKTSQKTGTVQKGKANQKDKASQKDKTSQKADSTKMKSKKRSRSDSEGILDAAEPAAKKVKDSQKAEFNTLTIPVDKRCALGAAYHVYIDPESCDPKGTIYDASLNYTEVGANSNKFYRMQVLSSDPTNFRAWFCWGRVGENGQTNIPNVTSKEGAINAFKKKFREKTGWAWENRFEPPRKGKYAFLERDYEEDGDEEEKLKGRLDRKETKAEDTDSCEEEVKSGLPLPVQSLMELIFNQKYFAGVMQDMNYDAKKLPLGKLSKKTLKSGFEKLKELAQVIADPSAAMTNYQRSQPQMIASLTDEYYTVIPHVFGRNRPPQIGDDKMLRREIDLLEALLDMNIANEIMQGKPYKDNGKRVHPLDLQYRGLGMQEMTTLDKKSNEFEELNNYLVKSHGQTHSIQMTVQEIFRIERQGEFKRFEDSVAKLRSSQRLLLWHGSRTTNFGGILSQDLRIAPPEAPINGYMFDKGIYLADMSSKSANYCCASASGNVGLLLLCEAELGKPMLELYQSNPRAATDASSQGMIATMGKGITVPKNWKDASCVHPDLKGVQMPDVIKSFPGKSHDPRAWLQYNEYITYDVSHVRLRYLFRVTMT
ncbi:MAG: hypothetical protein M1816_007557 [Peltula sp. TS41687]|nr:MAG: hypothetical protein M1816_007557 [Peltula sp. TS41687]